MIGQANDYGYFGSNATPITMTAPGEYRVDVTAIYTDAAGKMYMGSLTWGDVVMTPADQADLIAHGRRGLDTLHTRFPITGSSTAAIYRFRRERSPTA